jgi:hypothetical protein
MELIPLLTLWLFAPMDRSLPPVHAEELARFPAANVARQEHREAERKYQRAGKNYWWYYRNKLEGEAGYLYWSRQYTRTREAMLPWESLDRAHRMAEYDNIGSESSLSGLRNLIGPANYYAGQMPSPVYVPGMPVKKAGDK